VSPVQSGGESLPIDRSALEVISRGDPAIEGRMFAVFCSANDADIAALRRAISQRSDTGVARAAHRLLGASRIVGATTLAQACTGIAQAQHAGDWRALADAAATVERELDRVNAYLTALCERRLGESTPIAGLRFLVVDDHAVQRAALIEMMHALGARHIEEADDGRAALAAMQASGRHDIVITDLDMPGMDGMEFIRHLGEARQPVAVILTSVHDRALIASVAAMTEAYGIRLLGSIEKPATPHKLAALIALYERPLAAATAAASAPASDAEISAALAARLFEPLFQPKIDLATGRMTGTEALARWRHPQQGMIGPYAFIPALEASRRIDELTWIMLEKAAAACRNWRMKGLDATVSVNLSLATLSATHCADRIGDLVHAQALEPGHVVLEVTETAAMSNIARVLENLARLRMKGFGLSIDDYGTGYSSLQQLARIPFTELKIDQSFVMRALDRDSCRAIVESSIDIARKLGLTVVAEGVETRGDWELLKSLGCHIAQGYFIARPMEAGKLVAWAAAWSAPA